MKDTSSTALLVEFSTVFDEQQKDLSGYLTGISRDKLLMVTSFLLGFYNRGSKFESYYELLSVFFCEDNNGLANEIYQKLKVQEAKSSVPLKIINPLTALQIFEYSFDHADNSEIQIKAEIEQNIFKAILYQNEVNTTKQSEAFTSTEGIRMPFRVPLLSLSQSLPFSDLINYDQGELLAGQIVKSIFLFEFLESSPKTQFLYKAFLEYFECADWKDYLKRVMPLTLTIIKKPTEAHSDIDVKNGEHFERDCEFIEKLIIRDTEVIEDYDFKKIRARPFYKISEGRYRVIYDLFIIEILHKGVYFKLNEINKELNKTLGKADRIKDFRSLYCDDFSERYLLYSLLADIYANRYVKFTGTEIKASGIDAEPDYYIRTNNSILLFESKDILLNAEIKASYNFLLHEAEFIKKLYYEDKDGKRSNKAVLQLIKNIERCLLLQIPIDNEYKPEDYDIYPIVVLHDHMYKVPGLNYMVNQWFLKEKEELRKKGQEISRIKQLTIIDVDTFIFHQDILRDQRLVLDDVIDDYHKYVDLYDPLLSKDIEILKRQLYNKSVSFSTYLTNVVIDKGIYTPPKMIMEKGISLFS